MSEVNDRCPNCYSDRVFEAKSWEIKSPRSKSTLKVKQMKCRACGKAFRVTERIG